VRYRAADVYTFLKGLGCTFDGERYPHGSVWLAPGEQVFFLPDPDVTEGESWFDADVLNDNLKDRWVGFKVPLPLATYP
jgi:hypothetical protein